MALLQSGGTPNVAGYISDFAQRNYPQLNTVVVDRNSDVRAQVEQRISEVVAARPDVQQRLQAEPQLASTLHRYAERISETMHDARAGSFRETNTIYDRLFNRNTLSGFITSQTDPGYVGSAEDATHSHNESRLEQMGLRVNLMAINGHSGCNGCTRPHDAGPVACETVPVTPERAASVTPGQLRGETAFHVGNGMISTRAMLNSVMTGFHEFAHILQNQTPEGRAQFGKPESEIGADTFAALMMIREFGDVGISAVQNRLHDRATFGTSSGIHQSAFALRAALEWAQANPEQLRTLSADALFQRSSEIARDNTLSAQEVQAARRHGDNIIGGLGNDSYASRLQQALSGVEQTSNDVSLRVSLGQLQAAGQLSCSAQPREQAPEAKPEPTSPSQSSRRGGVTY
jgi:hypothetical protein